MANMCRLALMLQNNNIRAVKVLNKAPRKKK